MKAPLLIPGLLFVMNFYCVEHPSLAADQPPPKYMLPGDPATAWAEVEKVHQALRPPDGWRTSEPKPEEVARFQKQVREIAVSFANKALEFIARFPTNENVGDARITACTH